MIEFFLRLILAGVLGYAALAKLLSPAASQAGLEAFGFRPGSLRPIAWITLVALELGLAIGVLAGSEAAAWAAAALMALFAALTVSALLRGAAGKPCACFGANSRVTWISVGRNLALALGFASIPLLDLDHLSATGWLGILVGLALIGCAILGIALLGLAREVGMLRLQLGTQGALEIEGEGPEIGSVSPELSTRLPMDRERLGLAVFSSEGCHLCQTLSPTIENVAKDPLVSVGVFDEEAEAELWSALEVPGSPFAIAIGPDGRVLAKGTFNSLAQLESVLATADRRSRGEEPDDPEDSTERVMGRLPIGA